MKRLPLFWLAALFCLVSVPGVPSLLAMASAQTPSPSRDVIHPVRLITGAVDEGNLVTLRGTMNPAAKHAQDAGAAPDSLYIERTFLLLGRSDQQRQALEQLLNDQQNPKAPSYHGWLTPQQFGQEFGASPQDVQAITQWLEGHGLHVEAPMAGNSLISFSGTHAQLKAAFHTELHQYHLNGDTYYANATDPQIPAALAPAIRGFVSLNNFPRHPMHTAPKIIRRENGAWKAASASVRSGDPRAEFTTTENGMPFYAVAPYDLATIYNFLPLWNQGIDGTGQTIAIVSPSDINPADVDYFRSTFGLPQKKLNLIYYGPNPGKGDAESEAALDVEWAGAVAKGATIDLVVAGDTPTSGGIDGAAAYIINNNLASILNVSYGACEYELGTTGNQFYSELWQQAAAQGITVFVAAGDSGSASCDDRQAFAQYGLSVSGIASTPYNVAVGGTDFYGTYTDPAKYWNSTNNSSTLASATSYIPELPWNNSCASPQILAALQAGGLTDATTEAACNDFMVQGNFLNTAGGSGGASSCTTVGDSGESSCQGGYPKPAWQSGVAGIPADGVRDLPDVSLMAGNGVWGSFYVYCQSDATPSSTCDANNELEGAGGTSFASPILAGVLALVQQNTTSRQGNANYIFYKLAAAQRAAAGNATGCASENATTAGGCIFYDTTQGTNAMPCLSGTPNCTPSNAADTFGVLPGYSAGSGYDLATGLGSINVTNLVNSWSSASSTFLPTTVSLTSSGSTQVGYGVPITLNVTTAPAGAASTGTPGGLVGITTNSTIANNNSVGEITLSGGTGSLAVGNLAAGSYQLFAHYAGDATFAPGDSSGLTVTISPGSSTPSISAGRTTVSLGMVSGVSILITGAPTGTVPTGTISVVNATTGAKLGSLPLTAGGGNGVSPSAGAYVAVSSAQLAAGSNTITASYSGDSNYAPVAAFSTTIQLVPAFTVATNPTSLTLAPNASGAVTVIVTPANEGSLNPANLSFACPANLPSGLLCSFSAPAAGAGGTVTSTLALAPASSLALMVGPKVGTSTTHSGRPGLMLSALMAAPFMFLFRLRRRRPQWMAAVLLLVSCSWLNGCGGAPSAPVATTTTLAISPKAPAFQGAVTMTAQVLPSSGTGTPTGTVMFSSAAGTLGSAVLAGGTASLQLSSLPVGPGAVTAAYSGDSKYAGSTSASTSVDVTYSTTLSIQAKDNSGNTGSTNLNVTIQ